MELCIRPLEPSHRRDEFDCAVPSLNHWLAQVAGQHSKKGLSATQVLVNEAAPATVIAYYALTPCEVNAEQLTAALRKKLPRVVPGIRLGRLAVDRAFKGQGYGALMLVDAMRRAQTVSRQVGGFALFVDALDAAAAGFYQRFDFVPFPGQPLTLFLPLAGLALS